MGTIKDTVSKDIQAQKSRWNRRKKRVRTSLITVQSQHH